MNFAVLSLPRSRSAWLSKFLSFGKWSCEHDVSYRFERVGGLEEYFSVPYRGLVDTGLALEWERVREAVGVLVTVRRPVADVVRSLGAIGLGDGSHEALTRLDEALIAAERVADFSLEYRNLDSPENCLSLFRLCLGTDCPPEHLRMWNSLHIEANVVQEMEIYATHALHRQGYFS